MAKQTINIGTTANDGTGDAIRAAFGKVNDNFTEIYTANTGVNTGDQNLSAYATTAAVAAGYQPLDSDLTAISALTTTAYGRALLSTADAATLRSAIGVGTTDAPTFLGVNINASGAVPESGMAWSGSNHLAFFHNSAIRMVVLSTGTTIGSDMAYSWGSANIPTSASRDLILARDAPGILAQRNVDNAQTFRVYNGCTLNTPAANHDRATFGFTSNVLRIGTENAGTYTTARPIDFVTGGVVRMSIAAAGFVDANLPIGTADRFRSGAEGISVFASSGLNGGTGDFRVSLAAAVGVRVTAGLMYAFNSETTMFSGGLDTALGRNAAGVVEINNATAGVFRDLRCRSVIQQPPATITPASNGDFVVEATSNTSLTLKLKGTDGTVRSVALTLA